MHKTKALHHHPNCCICGMDGTQNGWGLKIDYQVMLDGSVKALISCPPEWEGYPGWVHGGIEAALIDGAMTHCLFAMDIVGVTADLKIRYKRPLELGHRAEITALCTRRMLRSYQLRAKVTQRGYQCAAATGIFMNLSPKKGR
jgi:uncharacterized protein (TIGR00369 family)